jgi:hypothetical protein
VLIPEGATGDLQNSFAALAAATSPKQSKQKRSVSKKNLLKHFS